MKILKGILKGIGLEILSIIVFFMCGLGKVISNCFGLHNLYVAWVIHILCVIWIIVCIVISIILFVLAIKTIVLAIIKNE